MSNIQIIKINAVAPKELEPYEFDFSYWIAFDHDMGEVIEKADTKREVERKLDEWLYF